MEQAGPSSRKEEKDLNVRPHPREATHELLHDLMKADKNLDELIYKRASLKNAQDLDSWGRKLEEVKKAFDFTEAGLKWVMERKREMYAAQDEEWAQQKADLRSQMEPFLQQEAEKRRTREGLLSKFTQEARDRYELDRENQRQRLQGRQ